MTATLRPLIIIILGLALLPSVARAQVEVLRARRELTGLSGTGAGGTIERALVRVDLRVTNVAYRKEVGVRWTSTDWRSHADAQAWWVSTFADGTERWQVVLDLGTVGRNVMAGGGRADMGPAFVRFAAFCRADGRAWWDSAGGADHAVALLAPTAQPLPQARTAPRVVRAGRELLLVGGQEREGYRLTVPDVLRLEPRTGAWERVAALPPSIPPAGAATGPGLSPTILVGYEAAVVGRTLLIVGGAALHVGTRSQATLRLDLDAGSWSLGAPMPAPLGDRRACVRGGELHLVPVSRVRPAGDGDRAFVYDLARDAWAQVAVAGLDLAVAPRHVAAPLDGGLALLAGRDLLVYDAATRTIGRRGALPCDLLGSEPACALGGQLLVANVEADLARGTADALLVDPLAGGATRLGRAALLPWRATLAAGPTNAVVPPGGGQVRTVETALVLPGDVSRVDVWAPLERALATGESRTVVRVARDVGPGRRITLRGADGPLSWTRGADAAWRDGAWVFETTELLAPELVWKPLIDDRTWFPGADLRLRRGETTTLTWSW